MFAIPYSVYLTLVFHAGEEATLCLPSSREIFIGPPINFLKIKYTSFEQRLI